MEHTCIGRMEPGAADHPGFFQVLDECRETATGRVSISTMHLAKGLEFRAVAVMACDDEAYDSPTGAYRDRGQDQADLEEVYNTERHLLYVACTRARDFLMVSGVWPSRLLNSWMTLQYKFVFE